MMLVYRTPRSGSRASTCCAQMQRCSAIISPVRYRFVFTRAPVVSCYRGGASAAEPGATCRLTIDQTLHVTRPVSHPQPCSVYISQYRRVLFVRLRTTASARHRTTMECNASAAKTDTVDAYVQDSTKSRDSAVFIHTWYTSLSARRCR